MGMNYEQYQELADLRERVEKLEKQVRDMLGSTETEDTSAYTPNQRP